MNGHGVVRRSPSAHLEAWPTMLCPSGDRTKPWGEGWEPRKGQGRRDAFSKAKAGALLPSVGRFLGGSHPQITPRLVLNRPTQMLSGIHFFLFLSLCCLPTAHCIYTIRLREL